MIVLVVILTKKDGVAAIRMQALVRIVMMGLALNVTKEDVKMVITAPALPMTKALVEMETEVYVKQEILDHVHLLMRVIAPLATKDNVHMEIMGYVRVVTKGNVLKMTTVLVPTVIKIVVLIKT